MTIIRPSRIAPALLIVAALSMIPSLLAAQSLRGSRSSVNRMYHHAVNHGIYFYKTGNGLRDAASEGRFVRLTGGDYRVVGASYPYVNPATKTFVERLAKQYRACGETLVVTSAARPKSMRLANSVDRSVHPTGIAVDLRKPRTRRCGAWLRSTLLSLEDRGVIEATEEYSPPHFHIAVFPNPYTRYVAARGGATYASADSPAKSSYRVRTGDSLWAIARRYDTTVERLRAANALRTSRLSIGQTLVIPGR